MTTDHRPLSDIRQDILDELSRATMKVGELLEEAGDQTELVDWVLTDLPLHPRTAERIRAMWLVHEDRPDADLPEAWKALCSI